MPPKRAAKRKSAGDERNGGSNEIANGRGAQSDPRPFSKRPKNTIEDDSNERDDPKAWTKWIKDVQENEELYCEILMHKVLTGIEKKTDKCRDGLVEHVASFRPGESKSKPMLEAANEIATSLHLEDSRKEGDAFFQQAQDVLASGAQLLKWHKDTDDAFKGKEVDTQVLLRWKKDRKDIKEVFAKGREYGGKIAANYLAPGTFNPSDLDNAKAGEHEKKAASMFQDSRELKPEDSWGAAAVEQFGYFKDLAQAVQFAADADDHGHGGDSDPRGVQ
ncbi:hypothetical protein PG989_012604 [Apiospora arundinis]|uniref:Uncharacterized protein n=1 Tax=Apiospora arundinis TaxID=335852 RepID=A0ABR2IH58_9PEZI